jgi:glutamate-1-semialdehyde 2,1-aminomutase
LNDWNWHPSIHPPDLADGYAGHVVDNQGRDYIDFVSAWGANTLGYGYAPVAEAVAAQARRFAGLGLPYPQFNELGELLCQVIPCAEVVRYGKNGSDATMGAVRLARAITGRETVLHAGYHGFHDWWMAGTPCEGIPAALRSLIVPLDKFTPESVERAFAERPGQIACLIFDTILPQIPGPDTVRQVMEIVRRHGALVIFDEVVSGCRVAPGGMQEVWGLTPDLACFGKGIANGMPLSVLAGPEEHMRHLGRVNYGMTFEGEAISIAAAVATIREMVEKDVCAELRAKGRLLKQEYERLAREAGLESRLDGHDARPHLWFADHGRVTERELRWLVVQEMVRRNVLTVGVFCFCYSHSQADLRATVEAFALALAVARKAVDRGSVLGLLNDGLCRSMGLC